MFIVGRCDSSGAPWVLLGSFWVVGFVRVRNGGRWVYSGS